MQDSVAGILRQRQPRRLSRLSGHPNPAFRPIQIVKTEVRNVASAQPQTCEQQQHCVIARAEWCIRFAGVDDALDGFRLYVTR
jgi:hypothetical protein